MDKPLQSTHRVTQTLQCPCSPSYAFYHRHATTSISCNGEKKKPNSAGFN